MKTKLKETDLKLESISVGRINPCNDFCENGNKRYTYTFESKTFFKKEDLKCFEIVKVPETILEFINHIGINTKDLIKWLNENYK